MSLFVPRPYVFDTDWHLRMLWFVDFSAGSKACFATTWDAARWISSNASVRKHTKAIHIPTGVGALLPEFVKQTRVVKRKKQEREVYARAESTEADRVAVMNALRFVLPPGSVEDL